MSDPQDKEHLPGRAEGSGQPKMPARKERSRQQTRPKRYGQDPCSDADSSVEAAEDAVSEAEMGDPQDEDYVPGTAEGSGQPKTPARKEVPKQLAESTRHRQEPRSSVKHTVSKEETSSPQQAEPAPGSTQGSGQPKKVAEKQRPRMKPGRILPALRRTVSVRRTWAILKTLSMCRAGQRAAGSPGRLPRERLSGRGPGRSLPVMRNQ